MKAYHNSAVLQFDDSTTGNAGAGVPVTVRLNSTQALVSIFDLDEVAIANPTTTDSKGNYAFKTADGVYDIVISEGTSDEVVLEKVQISEFLGLINDLSQAYTFKTIALMQASAIIFPAGKKIVWQGYYDASDGGSNWGVVASGAHTDDGGNVFSLANGSYVAANIKGKRNVKKFGAKDDDTFDSYAAVKVALGAYAEKVDIYFPAGDYFLSNHLWTGIQTKISGDGKYNSTLIWEKDTVNGAGILHDANTTVSDIGLVNRGTNGSTSMAMCLWSQGGSNGGYKSQWDRLRVDGWGYGIASSVTTDVNVDPVFSRSNSQMWLSTYKSIDFNACGRIIDVATSGVNAVSFKNCFFKGCTGTRIAYINGGVGFKFDTCAFESPLVELDIEVVQTQNLSIVDCYFEPANGIAADYCPNVSILRPTITQESFGNLSNFAFFRGHTTSSLSWGKLPLFSRVDDASFNGTATLPEDRYWANNDNTNVLTVLSNCASKNDDFRLDGIGASVTPNSAYDEDVARGISPDLPSNAVISTGTDATGRFTKYTDGTMICESVDVDFTGFTATGFHQLVWNFPVIFVGDLPSVTFCIAPLAGDRNNRRVDSFSAEVSSNRCIPSAYVVNAFNANPKLMVIAKGRYK